MAPARSPLRSDYRNDGSDEATNIVTIPEHIERLCVSSDYPDTYSASDRRINMS